MYIDLDAVATSAARFGQAEEQLQALVEGLRPTVSGSLPDAAIIGGYLRQNQATMREFVNTMESHLAACRGNRAGLDDACRRAGEADTEITQSIISLGGPYA